MPLRYPPEPLTQRGRTAADDPEFQRSARLTASNQRAKQKRRNATGFSLAPVLEAVLAGCAPAPKIRKPKGPPKPLPGPRKVQCAPRVPKPSADR